MGGQKFPISHGTAGGRIQPQFQLIGQFGGNLMKGDRMPSMLLPIGQQFRGGRRCGDLEECGQMGIILAKTKMANIWKWGNRKILVQQRQRAILLNFGRLGHKNDAVRPRQL
jgi:hypothetical protein